MLRGHHQDEKRSWYLLNAVNSEHEPSTVLFLSSSFCRKRGGALSCFATWSCVAQTDTTKKEGPSPCLGRPSEREYLPEERRNKNQR